MGYRYYVAHNIEKDSWVTSLMIVGLGNKMKCIKCAINTNENNEVPHLIFCIVDYARSDY